MEFSKQQHCVYYARYHLIFATKYRRKILKQGLGAYMQVVVKVISRHHPDIVFHEVNTDLDHIHLLVSIPPKMAVSKAVNIIKSNSAKSMRKKFPFLDGMYEKEGVGIWSPGYFVSTVGVNEETIRKYIEHQGQEDAGQVKLVF